MRARCCAVLRGAERAARRAQRAAPSGLTPTSRPLFSQLTTAEREKLFKLCNKHPTVREIVTGVKTEDGGKKEKKRKQAPAPAPAPPAKMSKPSSSARIMKRASRARIDALSVATTEGPAACARACARIARSTPSASAAADDLLTRRVACTRLSGRLPLPVRSRVHALAGWGAYSERGDHAGAQGQGGRAVLAGRRQVVPLRDDLHQHTQQDRQGTVLNGRDGGAVTHGAARRRPHRAVRLMRVRPNSFCPRLSRWARSM